jgi:hypothetical protein
MSKHITNIAKAFDLLGKWDEAAKKLCGDSIIALKELERLQIETRRIRGELHEQSKENMG